MAVRIDDGRSVAFDIKDYAQIDHGYAATIHKAQGVTVDRAHVLATPGMDSHGAYVALSRHRDGVDLHYGRDDFADQSKLVRALSRERGKDMASDYKPEQAFAERRGITFRERIVEIARQLPERAKSIFAGFRPQAQQARSSTIGSDRPFRSAPRSRTLCPCHRDIRQMREQAFAGPAAPARGAGEGRKGARRDPAQCRRRPGQRLAARALELAREAADGRSQGAIRAMQLEAEIRIDPAQRAERFVSDWQRLGQARDIMQRRWRRYQGRAAAHQPHDGHGKEPGARRAGRIPAARSHARAWHQDRTRSRSGPRSCRVRHDGTKPVNRHGPVGDVRWIPRTTTWPCTGS